jgi:low temperature requirement protein LtrA
VVAAGLWWLYFDNLDGTVVRRRAEQRKAWKPTLWIYGHLPLVIALIVTAVGLEHAITAVGHEDAEHSGQWLLAGGISAVLVALALIQVAADSEASPASRRRTGWTVAMRLAGAATIAMVGIVFAHNIWWLVIAVTLLCVLEVAGDVVIAEKSRSLTGLTRTTEREGHLRPRR